MLFACSKSLLDRNEWFADFPGKLFEQMGAPGYRYNWPFCGSPILLSGLHYPGVPFDTGVAIFQKYVTSSSHQNRLQPEPV
jgi:hypothetical protein